MMGLLCLRTFTGTLQEILRVSPPTLVVLLCAIGLIYLLSVVLVDVLRSEKNVKGTFAVYGISRLLILSRSLLGAVFTLFIDSGMCVLSMLCFVLNLGLNTLQMFEYHLHFDQRCRTTRQSCHNCHYPRVSDCLACWLNASCMQMKGFSTPLCKDKG